MRENTDQKNSKYENFSRSVNTQNPSLESHHIPFHMLCVSYTCALIDSGNLTVLMDQGVRNVSFSENVAYVINGFQYIIHTDNTDTF